MTIDTIKSSKRLREFTSRCARRVFVCDKKTNPPNALLLRGLGGYPCAGCCRCFPYSLKSYYDHPDTKSRSNSFWCSHGCVCVCVRAPDLLVTRFGFGNTTKHTRKTTRGLCGTGWRFQFFCALTQFWRGIARRIRLVPIPPLLRRGAHFRGATRARTTQEFRDYATCRTTSSHSFFLVSRRMSMFAFCLNGVCPVGSRPPPSSSWQLHAALECVIFAKWSRYRLITEIFLTHDGWQTSRAAVGWECRPLLGGKCW